MLESLVPVHGSNIMVRRVALEPDDLAKYKKLLDDHLYWCSIAQEFLANSEHLKHTIPKLLAMKKDIEDLINYGTPSEVAQTSHQTDED